VKPIKGFPSTSQDDYQLNIMNIARHGVRNFSRQEIACQCPQGMFRYTYLDAFRRMNQFAGALKALGVSIGDRIGVLDWNSHRNYEMYFAIPGSGAVMLLLNLRLSPPDLSYVIHHAEASWIVVDETLLPIAEMLWQSCKNIRGFIILTDKNLSDIQTTLSPVFSYEALIQTQSPEFEWPNLDETSAAGACYTTGTTGQPKGVYYSHRDTYLHAMTICSGGEMSYRDAFLQLVPMFHAMGWGGVYSATMAGSKIVLPGMYRLDRLGELAELLVKEKITVCNGAPAILMPMLEYIRNLENKPDLRGARFLCGATEPPVAMMKGYKELTGAEIIHAYGATETSPLVSINRLKPWLEDRLSDDEKWDLRRKQGYVVTGLDVKLLGPDNAEVPHDGITPGEICVRGPWITGCYHRTPMSDQQFTADGFWRSGDVATMDAEGYLKITDRVKDVIKSGGEWISSVDMENELMSYHPVLEAAVVGISHPKWEERPLALVILREEHRGKIGKDALLSHLAHKFAKWQLPDEILFVEEIPKTSVGKFNKKVIREVHRDRYTVGAG